MALAVDAGFEDPVLLNLLTGAVHVLDEFKSSGGKSEFGKLPLADFPLMITERGEIDV